MQDVIGREDDDDSGRGVDGRLQRLSLLLSSAGRTVTCLVLAAVLGGVFVTGQLSSPPSPPAPSPRLEIVLDGGRAVADGRTATGVLRLRVVNPTTRPAALLDLVLSAPGLDQLSVEPSADASVPAQGERRYAVRYVVRDCGALRLPGVVELSVLGGGRHSRPVGTAAGDRDVEDFRPCPTSAVPPPPLAVRPLGGTTERAAAGASGVVRLEVRNGGAAVQLRSVTAEVPGVRFRDFRPQPGVVLHQDERLELLLRFSVEDCERLSPTGRLVLRAARDGVEGELGLTITNDWEAGTVRQVALDRVLDACSP